MKNQSRLLIYILINILISVLVTLAVLWIWDLTHMRPDETKETQATVVGSEQVQTNQTGLADEKPTNTPGIDFVEQDFQVSIHAIVGIGNLDVEYIEIRNQDQGPIDLTGWQLVDEQDQRFTFPALILNSGGAIKVLSSQGSNTVIELYWQSDTSIWQSGETAKLLNASGELIDTYSIP